MVFGSESDDDVIVDVQQAVSNEIIRIYRSTDLVGVEMCGCLKNIYAIGAGIGAPFRRN